MSNTDYDLCVIGGGVNGAGIARDAAGRGLSVLLVEAQDLASATSSASTKIVHGGLRYLETYEFRLVREALKEREVLLSLAPHIIWPLDFVLPHRPHLRPGWLIRMGLFLYDHLARRKKLAGSKALNFKTHLYGKPLKDHIKKGFQYSDCWVEDSRLVALNAMDARNYGAEIMNYTACASAVPEAENRRWMLSLQNTLSGDQCYVTSKMLVNAAGPWVRSFIDGSDLETPDWNPSGVRLVKGSHIVVKKLYETPQAFILQNEDGRIVFTIPYEQHYTLIGTTDVEYEGDPSQTEISQNEIDYLCGIVNESFEKQITPDDVVWSYSGVRSLLDDGKENASSVTRDYKLDFTTTHGVPLLNIFGGKITTYRKLAEEAVNILAGHIDLKRKAWTSKIPLPGGDISGGDFETFLKAKKSQYAWLPYTLLYRYARAYGTFMDDLIGSAKHLEDLGKHYGDHVYEREILYLIGREFVQTLDDMLWRRSKLGLHIKPETYEALKNDFEALKEKKFLKEEKILEDA